MSTSTQKKTAKQSGKKEIIEQLRQQLMTAVDERSEAVKLMEEAQQKTEQADNARQSAEQAAEQAKEGWRQADNARQSAEQAAEQAKEGWRQADQARQSAEQVAAAAEQRAEAAENEKAAAEQQVGVALQEASDRCQDLVEVEKLLSAREEELAVQVADAASMKSECERAIAENDSLKDDLGQYLEGFTREEKERYVADAEQTIERLRDDVSTAETDRDTAREERDERVNISGAVLALLLAIAVAVGVGGTVGIYWIKAGSPPVAEQEADTSVEDGRQQRAADAHKKMVEEAPAEEEEAVQNEVTADPPPATAPTFTIESRDGTLTATAVGTEVTVTGPDGYKKTFTVDGLTVKGRFMLGNTELMLGFDDGSSTRLSLGRE